jgi:hypothetical protein
VHIRYLWPDQLDALASAAGLVPGQQWASWRQVPFEPDREGHVSVYRRPVEPRPG